MRPSAEDGPVYLCREPVDFRKSITGLSLIVEQALGLDPFGQAVYVFTNRQRNKIKLLIWSAMAFVCGSNAWRRIGSCGHGTWTRAPSR